jgi:hypothetical protein
MYCDLHFRTLSLSGIFVLGQYRMGNTSCPHTEVAKYWPPFIKFIGVTPIQELPKHINSFSCAAMDVIHTIILDAIKVKLKMEKTKKEIRAQLIDLIGEGAWQYAYYNFDLKSIITKSGDINQIAETIQDLIADELRSESRRNSLPEFE